MKKHRVFSKQFNIGIFDAETFNDKLKMGVDLCSNETVQTSLDLTDIQMAGERADDHYELTFSKHALTSGSKFSNQLIRFKDFFFVLQSEMTTLDQNESSGVLISLFCMTEER